MIRLLQKGAEMAPHELGGQQAGRPGPVARRADKCPLGEFEHQVMVAVKHCEPEAYGVRICERLLAIYGASLALAQVYVTLNRLERKGFLSSSWTDPKPTLWRSCSSLLPVGRQGRDGFG